jgi:hypothetical protein
MKPGAFKRHGSTAFNSCTAPPCVAKLLAALSPAGNTLSTVGVLPTVPPRNDAVRVWFPTVVRVTAKLYVPSPAASAGAGSVNTVKVPPPPPPLPPLMRCVEKSMVPASASRGLPQCSGTS